MGSFGDGQDGSVGGFWGWWLPEWGGWFGVVASEWGDPVVVAVGGAFEVEFAAVFGSVVVSAAGAEVGVDGVPAGGLSWLVGGDVVDVGEVRGLPAAG